MFIEILFVLSFIANIILLEIIDRKKKVPEYISSDRQFFTKFLHETMYTKKEFEASKDFHLEDHLDRSKNNIVVRVDGMYMIYSYNYIHCDIWALFHSIRDKIRTHFENYNVEKDSLSMIRLVHKNCPNNIILIQTYPRIV